MAFSFLSGSSNPSKGGNTGFSFLSDGGSDVARQVSNLQARLNAAGVQVPEQKSDEGLLTKLLDIIDRPRNALATGIKYATDTNPRTGFTQGLGEGITGKTRTTGSEFIKSDNKLLKAVGGFGLDVLMDPTTYVGGAAIKAAGTGLKAAGVGKALTALRGTQTAQKYVEPVLQGLGKAFIPNFGLPEEYSALKNQYKAFLNYRRGKALEKVADIAKRYGLNDAEAELVLVGRENPILLKGADQRVIDAAREFKRMFKAGIREEQAAGIKVSERPRYAPHVKVDTGEVVAPGRSTTPLRPSDKFTRSRTLEGTVEDINQAAGRQIFDPNIVTAAGVREYSRVGAVTTKQFIDRTLEQFGRKVKVGTKVGPDEGLYAFKDFQLYPVEDVAGNIHRGFTKNVPTWALPKEIANDLNTFYKTFANDEGTKAFLGMWDKLQTLWKGSVTSLRPSFHIRNFFGNVFNNWLAGVNDPSRYYKAAEIMAGREGSLQVGGKTLSNAEVMELFKKRGLAGTGQFYGDIRATVREALNQSRLTGAQKVAYNIRHPVIGGRAVGNTIEDNSKLAHFIDRLLKGDTPERAAQSVKKYLFDYTDLTPFEKNVMRRIAPFYTFFRKNAPLQFEQFLKQPGKYAAVGHAVANASEVTGQGKEQTPDWLREQMALPVGGNKYFTPGLPLGDLNKGASDLLGMITPALKLPIEFTTNRSLFNDRPIEEYQGQQVPLMGTNVPAKVAYAATQVGTVRDLRDLASMITNPGVKAKYPVLSSFIKEVDPQKQKLAELYNILDRLRAAQKKAEQEQGKRIPKLKEFALRGGGKR